MRKLTVIVGLPGSGKTTLMKKLKRKATGLCVDDYMKDLAEGSPIKRDPSFTDSRHYAALIRDLRAGKHCVISDIIFCDTRVRLEVESIVKMDVPNIKLIWEYFENSAEKCESNARRRGRTKTLAREIKLIKFLSRKYYIPIGRRPHSVWSGGRRRITSQSNRRAKARG